MITLQQYDICSFSKLKNDWTILEQGKDMTGFQQYAWYTIINEQYKAKANFIPGKVVYVVAYENEKVRMIAPLIIVKTPSIMEKFYIESGAHILGKWGYTDYLNFIYDDFSEECFEKIVEFVRKTFRIEFFNIHQILPNTAIHDYLDKRYPESVLFDGDCAKIPVRGSFEEYHKGLSKGVRQSLRTAQNRADKSGTDIHYEVHRQISEKDAQEFLDIYYERQIAKNSGAAKGNLKTRTLAFAKKLERRKGERYNFIKNAMMKAENGFLLGCYSGKTKIGLCFGCEDNYAIRITAVGFRHDYARYSPCMLCIFNYIRDTYADGSIKIFDLLKGTEQYKFSLGAERFSIRYYRIRL